MKKSLRMLASLILALAVLFVAAPVEAAPAKRDCPKQTGDSSMQVPAIPVVYVHGWTGTGADAERDVLPLLQKAMESRYEVFAFDYGWANTTWGAEEKISGCLAQFVEHLSDANRAAQGSGQVAIVAHSMGGLVSRAATTYLAQDGRSEALAGIVTLGTPHQGTPFSGALTTLQENVSRATPKFAGSPIPQWNKVATPPDDSPASKCLAFPHPAPCAPVPYVQPGQKIASIAGQINMTVTFFGLKLRDAAVIDAGDSIVPTASALGYQGSFTGSSPRGSYLGEKTVVCQRTTSQINALSLQLGFFDLADVNSYLDEAASGRAGTGMSSWAFWLNYLGSPCNHGALPTSTEALADAAGFISDMHIGAAQVVKVTPDYINTSNDVDRHTDSTPVLCAMRGIGDVLSSVYCNPSPGKSPGCSVGDTECAPVNAKYPTCIPMDTSMSKVACLKPVQGGRLDATILPVPQSGIGGTYRPPIGHGAFAVRTDGTLCTATLDRFPSADPVWPAMRCADGNYLYSSFVDSGGYGWILDASDELAPVIEMGPRGGPLTKAHLSTVYTLH